VSDKTVALASDHAGYALKTELAGALVEWGYAVEDLGAHDTASVDYPDYAHRLAQAVSSGKCGCGVLVCGTGIGMGIAANRHRGVRAAVCTDPYAARMSREHNDANVLCLGSRVTGAGLARETLRAFLAATFEGGRHAARVRKLDP
jgi:ribose 5-phosphate isomerase B